MDMADIHEVLKISGASRVHIFSDKLIAENGNLQVIKTIQGYTAYVVIEKKIIDLMPKHGECEVFSTGIKCGRRSIEFQEVNKQIVENKLNGLITDAQVIDRKVLDELLQVEYAVSTDEARPILKGIHFDNDTVVALDGYRMALRKSVSKLDLQASFTVSPECIKALRKTKSTKPVIIEFDGVYIKFIVDDIQIVSKLLEGKYVNYKSLIPVDHKLSIDTQASNISSIINSYNKDVSLVEFDIQNENLRMEAKIQKEIKKKVKNDKGIFEIQHEWVTTATINDEIDVKSVGDPIRIAFNPAYLKDALKDKENVKMQFTSPISPLIITEGDKLELVLPVRIMRGTSTR